MWAVPWGALNNTNYGDGNEMRYLESKLIELKKFAESCRVDMHEPDEQCISAHVIGDHLDNANGERIRLDAIEEKWQEFVVILTDESDNKCKINLATLIALARLAVVDLRNRASHNKGRDL